MIKVEVESTFEPIIGSEVQSKELIDYSNEIDRRAREDVVNIIQRQKKTNKEKVKELQDDFQ